MARFCYRELKITSLQPEKQLSDNAGIVQSTHAPHTIPQIKTGGIKANLFYIKYIHISVNMNALH